MELNYLLSLTSQYIDDNQKIIDAYSFASKAHFGQFRQSGEDYIIHPLETACILAKMRASENIICAALLHDVLEDTSVTRKELLMTFGTDILTLVDGVTNLTQLTFSSNNDKQYANDRKIITSIKYDPRVVAIKLADRLHNMRTLEYKSVLKQKEKALETMEIYAPLAFFLGAYHIQHELEDLSFKYLDRENFDKYDQIRKDLSESRVPLLFGMCDALNNKFKDYNIKFNKYVRVKNTYGIYKRVNDGKNLNNIFDLFTIRIIVNDMMDCYRALGIIHGTFKPVNDQFKDYIANPKTNMYKSIHTTVYGPSNTFVQFIIRTKEMDKYASYGVLNNLTSNNKESVDKLQFIKSIDDINEEYNNNSEFITRLKDELFSKRIYVYTNTGERVELPMGATVLDFAYKLSKYTGDHVALATVNEREVPLDYVLNENDRIVLVCKDELLEHATDYSNMLRTTTARRRIMSYINDKKGN